MTNTMDEVIQILKNDIELSKMNALFCHNNEYGIGALRMAVEKLEQTRWVPVSERLPEEYIHVLCQFTLGGMGECYLSHGWFHIAGGGLVMTCNEVIAWMPLPEPYRGEEAET